MTDTKCYDCTFWILIGWMRQDGVHFDRNKPLGKCRIMIERSPMHRSMLHNGNGAPTWCPLKGDKSEG